MNDSILKKAIDIANFSDNVPGEQRCDYLIQAQDLLLEHLEKFPQDTKAWLLLTRIECNSPLYDHERIYSWCNSVLSYDPENVYALLFLSYADHYLTGNSDNKLINKLSQAKSDHPELLSLIEIAKARYWEDRNKEEYEKSLLNSISLCKKHVRNYEMLAKFYTKQKKINLAIPLIKQAIINQKELRSKNKNDDWNVTDMNDLLEEFFIGYGICNKLRDLVKEYDKVN